MVPKIQSTGRKTTPLKIWLQPDVDWEDFPPRWDTTSITDYVEGYLKTSEGHQVSKLGESGQDIGGDFEVRKRKYAEYSSLGKDPLHFSAHHEYGNPYYADPMAKGITHHFYVPRASRADVTDESFLYPWEDFSPSSATEMDASGTTAISRIIPTNPIAGAAAFLGELREGIPKLGIESWQDRAHRARSAGSDYLNVEFGWKPLVSDIQKFAYVAKNADRIAAKYERESGKLLRRQYKWPNEQTSYFGEYTGEYPQPVLDYGLFRPDHIGRMRIYGNIIHRRWLEATFTYYLPPVGTRARDIAIANKLLGVRLTPDVVWQLTPWSWAADWVTNFGDITKNVSAFMSDGLVMPYAYMMEQKSLRVEYTLDQVGFKSYPGFAHMSQTFEEVIKSRRRATPFGFGFDLDSLTDRQVAIIAALGMSRKK